MKNSELNNKHKNKYGKLKTILLICSFKHKRFPYRGLTKHKDRLCAHGGIQKRGVNYWETYAPGVNRISVRSILDIASIHELLAYQLTL